MVRITGARLNQRKTCGFPVAPAVRRVCPRTSGHRGERPLRLRAVCGRVLEAPDAPERRAPSVRRRSNLHRRDERHQQLHADRECECEREPVHRKPQPGNRWRKRPVLEHADRHLPAADGRPVHEEHPASHSAVIDLRDAPGGLAWRSGPAFGGTLDQRPSESAFRPAGRPTRNSTSS